MRVGKARGIFPVVSKFSMPSFPVTELPNDDAAELHLFEERSGRGSEFRFTSEACFKLYSLCPKRREFPIYMTGFRD